MRRVLIALCLLVPVSLRAADPPKAPPVAGGTFAGTWDTTYGPMTLTEKDGAVSGFYVGGGAKNEITGKVKDHTLTFTYTEPPATSGEGEFTLAADGDSFTGKWRPKGETEWGTWGGKRVKAAVKNFDGVWRSRTGMMRLIQDGNKVRGHYQWGPLAGTVEGTVKDKALAFTYSEPHAKDGKVETVEGSGTFTLAEDADSYTGTWKAKGDEKEQTWPVCHRVPPTPGRQWLVVVEANWEGSIEEPEYSFGGMLRAFFARAPAVSVRHRWFTDEDSLQRWLREVSFIPDPVVISIAAHGSPDGPASGKGTVSAAACAAALKFCPNVKALHFSACEVMNGDFPADFHKALGADATFPVSGYTTSVDWAGSALAEFLYYELILCRGLDPEKALAQVLKMAPFAGDKSEKDQPIRSLGMKLRAAPTASKGSER